MEPIGRRQDVDAKEQAEEKERAKRDQLKQTRTRSSFVDRMNKPKPPATPPAPSTPNTSKSAAAQPEGKPANRAANPNTPQQAPQGQAAQGAAKPQPGLDIAAQQQASASSVQPERDEANQAGKPAGEAMPTSETDAPTLPGIPPSLLHARPPAVPPRGASTAPPVSPQQLQEIIRYASVAQNADGQAEFFLGLTGAVAGGMQIRLTALGQRRLKLRLTHAGDDGPGDEQVRALIQALRGRGIEVVEVERE